MERREPAQRCCRVHRYAVRASPGTGSRLWGSLPSDVCSALCRGCIGGHGELFLDRSPHPEPMVALQGPLQGLPALRHSSNAGDAAYQLTESFPQHEKPSSLIQPDALAC